MPVPRSDAAFGQPEWLENFQAWVASLSPATLADLLEVLALELRERDIGDQEALGKATVREHHAVRVPQLDAFLVEPQLCRRRAVIRAGRPAGPSLSGASCSPTIGGRHSGRELTRRRERRGVVAPQKEGDRT